MSAPPLIVIFGAAVRPDGRPSAALLRRIAYGFEAAQAHPDALVVCSGGVGRVGPSEASVMVDVLARAGLARERLLADEASLDTLQTAVMAARKVHAEGWTSALAVSDGYHLPRIRLLLAMLGVRSASGPRPGGFPRGPWSHRLGMSLREAMAIPYDMAIVAVRRRRLLS